MMARMDKLVIVDGGGNETLLAKDEGDEVDLAVYEYVQGIAIGASLDAGGVAALCDWLTAWIARREAEAVDDRQAALLLGDG